MASELPDNTQFKRRARRRLIGAIALVLLAVILLPMIFDSERKPVDQDISIQIPSQGDYKAPPVPTDQKSAPGPEAPVVKDAPKEAAKVEAPKAEVVPQAEVKPEAKPEVKPDAKAGLKPATEAPKDAKDSKTEAQKTRELADAKRAEALLNGAAAAPKSEKSVAKADVGGFAVQVGAFSTDEKVQEARDKLTAAGMKSYVEKVPTKDGSVTRVRAGPYASKDAAEAALGKISVLGFGNAKVVAR
jgi:DedD protein